MSVAEKRALLDALLAAGLPPARLMPGTGCCAIPDSIELTRRAVEAGAGGVLMLPPFYYKGVSEEGLYRAFASVIDAVADERLRVYLYHIPPVSNVPIPRGVVARLLKAYPGIVAGMKDSGGDWKHTQAMIEEFGPQGFDVFAGSETFLLADLRAGGPGCITTATANGQSHEDRGALQDLAQRGRRRPAAGAGRHARGLRAVPDDPGHEGGHCLEDRARGLDPRAPAAGGTVGRTAPGAARRPRQGGLHDAQRRRIGVSDA